MPSFVKMGLGGTGYLGKPTKHKRATQRAAARRKVLPGYPVHRPFESLDEVREYLSGDRITCLLCGKTYRVLGVHILKIHGVTADEYRERYRIPWSYGLLCAESHEKKSDVIKKRMEEGYSPADKSGEFASKMKATNKRNCPFKGDVARENAAKYNASRPKKPKPPKKPKRSPRPKSATWGSEEHREKLRRNAKKCGFGYSWKGRKQSKEHVAKRVAAYEAYLVRTGKKKPKHVHVDVRECRMCGCDVKQPEAGRKLYCSVKCRSEYYAANRPKVRASCALCGEVFIASRSQVLRVRKSLPVYCSVQCRQTANGCKPKNKNTQEH